MDSVQQLYILLGLYCALIFVPYGRLLKSHGLQKFQAISYYLLPSFLGSVFLFRSWQFYSMSGKLIDGENVAGAALLVSGSILFLLGLPAFYSVLLMIKKRR